MTQEVQSKSVRTSVFLAPDDIITLRLLKDQWQRFQFETHSQKRRDVELESAIETLERILKQVG